MDLLIRQGRLVDPATDTDRICDILMENGKIMEIAPEIKTFAPVETIDATGLVVSPGFIDIHVHFREPGQEHKEDIESGSRAAVRGGFTSVVCMPNTTPVCDSVEVVSHMVNRAKEVGLLNVFPTAAVSKDLKSGRITDMDALVQAGAKGFTDDGRCVMSEDIFKDALARAKTLKVPVMEHAEDHDISQDGQVNDGPVAVQCRLKGIPAKSEDVIIDRDIKLQEEADSYLHLTHLSTEGGMRSIREAKKKNIYVTSDVTPHHLLLDEESIEGCDPMYKMKPPLRSAKDRLAMIEGIKTGVIDCIATDHAPHSREEKAQPFEKAPFGVIGLETSFNVCYDRLVRPGIISLKQLIQLFATNPARVMFLEDRGVVKPGVPADLTILDLEADFKIDENRFQSRSVNCPFIGWEGKGVVQYTIVDGRQVYSREASG